jgi:hypothetical protein
MNDGEVIEGRIGLATETDVLIADTAVAYADIKKALIEIEFKSTVKSDDEASE